MSLIARLIETIRSEGRSVENTTVELIEHLEGRIAALEAKVLGEDTPKAPEPKRAPEDDGEAPKPDQADEGDAKPIEAPKATTGDVPASQVEAAAIHDIADQQTVTTAVAGDDPTSKPAPGATTAAPVPLPNTDEEHPADPEDPVKTGFAAIQAKADAPD